MNTTQNADLMLIVERQGLMGPSRNIYTEVFWHYAVFVAKKFFGCRLILPTT